MRINNATRENQKFPVFKMLSHPAVSSIFAKNEKAFSKILSLHHRSKDAPKALHEDITIFMRLPYIKINILRLRTFTLRAYSSCRGPSSHPKAKIEFLMRHSRAPLKVGLWPRTVFTREYSYISAIHFSLPLYIVLSFSAFMVHRIAAAITIWRAAICVCISKFVVQRIPKVNARCIGERRTYTFSLARRLPLCVAPPPPPTSYLSASCYLHTNEQPSH